jgi:hypothetical protein
MKEFKQRISIKRSFSLCFLSSQQPTSFEVRPKLYCDIPVLFAFLKRIRATLCGTKTEIVYIHGEKEVRRTAVVARYYEKAPSRDSEVYSSSDEPSETSSTNL